MQRSIGDVRGTRREHRVKGSCEESVELVQSQRTSKPPRVPSAVLFASGVKRIGADAGKHAASGGARVVATSVASRFQPVALKLRGVASVYGPSLADPCKTPRNVLASAFRNLRRTALATKCTRLAERFAGPNELALSRAYSGASEWLGSVTRLSHVWRSVRPS